MNSSNPPLKILFAGRPCFFFLKIRGLTFLTHIENKIRPLALVLKNYLFVSSHDTPQRIAMVYSFIGSRKANEINPYEWLKSTWEKIPEMKLSALHQLIPGKNMLLVGGIPSFKAIVLHANAMGTL